MNLAQRLYAMANAEARHGIGRQRRDLFNEAGDVINGLTARAEAAEKQRDELRGRVRALEQEWDACRERWRGAALRLSEASCLHPLKAAESRIAVLTALRDNQEFVLEYIEEHFPEAFEEAEHALAEWDGKS